MADITLNSAVRANLRTMQATTELMNRTENRLSTGKKVNSALDNPTNFFTAQALERRSGNLGSLLDSVSNSVKTLEAADNGISAITDLLEQMKSTARSAQQSPSAIGTRAGFTSSVSGLTADNLLTPNVAATVTGTAVTDGTNPVTATSDIADISPALAAGDTLTVNGKTIKFYADQTGADAGDGDYNFSITAGDTTVQDVLDSIEGALGTGSSATIDATGAITVTGADATQSFTFGGTNAAAALGLPTTANAPTSSVDGQTLTVQVGDDASTAKTITFGTGTGEVSTLDALNTQLADVGAKASLDADGKLTIETTNDHEADKLTVGGTSVDTASATSATALFDFAATTDATKEAVTDADKTKRTNYMNDYNDLRDQIGKLAKDASYNGINLLAGDDLKVVFNEDGSSKLDISGVDVMDTLGLSDLVDGDFLDSSSIDGIISKIDDAMSNLDGLSSKFGSQLSVVQTRQDFTKDMIGTLDDGANLLTAADTNEEAANLATLQTRQSLIVSSLSISTQQEQNILQLLR